LRNYQANGPICFQQSRQEVGGDFESYDPQVGDGYTAQVNEDGRRFKPNSLFDGVAGNVVIGRLHGSEMLGLSAHQREEVLNALKAKR
jgi:hypothetical protein